MKTIQKWGFLAIFFFLILGSCKNEEPEVTEEANETEQYIAEVREQYAPDGRVALFDIEASQGEDAYVLKGESNLPEAVQSLKSKLEAENIAYTDSIQMLPSEELEGKTEGVVKISVANLRSKPSHSAELVTQATIGTPVKVYKKDGGWYYIQTPDGYLAWVDYGGVATMNKEEIDEWKSKEKVVFLDPFGFSYKEATSEAPVVGDLVAGGVLELQGEQNGFYKVKYPNGKEAFVEKESARPYKEWVNSLDPSGESLVETSKSLMGLPYLWGGTSSKGVDCSGYTKTVYFLNGMVLPRDASQQIKTGIVVDSTRNFENLVAGDLLFFGRKATDSTSERVVHVGMWIGDNKFIHSMGEVHVSNMDTTATDFDEYNYNRYLRTKRILDQNDEQIIQLANSDLYLEED